MVKKMVTMMTIKTMIVILGKTNNNDENIYGK